MKRIAKTILGCACAVSVVLAGAENPDGTVNIIWTLSFLAAAVLAAYGWKKLGNAK